MSARAAASQARARHRRAESDSGGGLRAVPLWARWTIAIVLVGLLLGGLLYFVYRSLDAVYPQALWMYFRPSAPVGTGSVLYRDGDGQLLLAPIGDPQRARRLTDPGVEAGAREIVRDAVALPDGKAVAYFATERRERQGEVDRVKLVALDGGEVRSLPLDVGEPLRPAVFTSTSGRYLAVTNRERTRVYYSDLSGDASFVPGAADAAPERMLWTRNADLRTALLPGQPAFASSPDGKLRAQVRSGSRREPECGDRQCETVQELTVSSGTVAGSSQPPAVLYGAFNDFSSEGWGPIPTQPAQRFFGRLVWSADDRQVLFSTLDGVETRTYSIGVDGRTQPRLVLASGEALDWLP